MSKQHYRACNLCEAMCGIVVETQGTEVLSIKGDKNDPFSRGHICPKAVALKDLYDDPERLRSPMIKRAGQWQNVSWDEAFDETAKRLAEVQEQHGRDAVGTYLGNPNVHNLGALMAAPGLLKVLRTKNKFSATSVDQLPHHILAMKMFGHQLKIPVPDIDRTDFFVLFGSNPVASNGSLMTVPDVKNRIKELTERGQFITVDPRRSESAAIANQHIFIKPGTDVLMIAAMLNVLFAEGRTNLGKLAEHIDIDPHTLAEEFADYTPESVEAITGVPAATVRQLVADFCAAERPVMFGRMGLSTQQFGMIGQYLIMLFNLLTARVDMPGGMMFTSPAANALPQTGRGHVGKYHSRVRGLPEFNGELPAACMAEEITTPGEGQIKAMVIAAGNPVLSTPNGEQLDKAFEQLDFMVCVDFYMNETNRHADVILPPVSPLERDHYDLIFHLLAVRNTARYADAVFERPAEGRHDWEIYRELEKRLVPKGGLGDQAKRAVAGALKPKHMLDLLLRQGKDGAGFNPLGKGHSLRELKKHPHGIDLGPLREQLPKALLTRDKKINLSADFFMADMQRVRDTYLGDNEPAPFLLIGRRHIRSNNSWLHNSQRLVKGKPRCTAMIHPDDAARLSIENGSTVTIRSRVGEIQIAAEITDEIMPGVVSVPHGWGHSKKGTQWSTAEANAGVSCNDLTDEMLVDELIGTAAVNGVPVELVA